MAVRLLALALVCEAVWALSDTPSTIGLEQPLLTAEFNINVSAETPKETIVSASEPGTTPKVQVSIIGVQHRPGGYVLIGIIAGTLGLLIAAACIIQRMGGGNETDESTNRRSSSVNNLSSLRLLGGTKQYLSKRMESYVCTCMLAIDALWKGCVGIATMDVCYQMSLEDGCDTQSQRVHEGTGLVLVALAIVSALITTYLLITEIKNKIPMGIKLYLLLDAVLIFVLSIINSIYASIVIPREGDCSYYESMRAVSLVISVCAVISFIVRALFLGMIEREVLAFRLQALRDFCAVLLFTFLYSLLAIAFRVGERRRAENGFIQSIWFGLLLAVDTGLIMILIRSLVPKAWEDKYFWATWVVANGMVWLWSGLGYWNSMHSDKEVYSVVAFFRGISYLSAAMIIPILMLNSKLKTNLLELRQHVYFWVFVVPLSFGVFGTVYSLSIDADVFEFFIVTIFIMVCIFCITVILFDKNLHDEISMLYFSAFTCVFMLVGVAEMSWKVFSLLDGTPLSAVIAFLFLNVIFFTCISLVREVLERLQSIQQDRQFPPVFALQIAEDLYISALFLRQELSAEFAVSLLIILGLSIIRDSGFLHEVYCRYVRRMKSDERIFLFMGREFYYMQQNLGAEFVSAPVIFVVVLTEYALGGAIGQPSVLTYDLTTSQREDLLIIYAVLIISKFVSAPIGWNLFEKRLMRLIDDCEDQIGSNGASSQQGNLKKENGINSAGTIGTVSNLSMDWKSSNPIGENSNKSSGSATPTATKRNTHRRGNAAMISSSPSLRSHGNSELDPTVAARSAVRLIRRNSYSRNAVNSNPVRGQGQEVENQSSRRDQRERNFLDVEKKTDPSSSERGDDEEYECEDKKSLLSASSRSSRLSRFTDVVQDPQAVAFFATLLPSGDASESTKKYWRKHELTLVFSALVAITSLKYLASASVE